MRIGFDISQTGKDKAGCGYFAYSLAQTFLKIAPEHDYLFYPDFGPYYRDPSVLKGELALKAYRIQDYSRDKKQIWAQSNDLEFLLGAPDIIHANNFYVPFGLKKTRLVYTLYDISFLHHPEWHTEQNWIVTTLGGVYYASVMADGIIAISEYSKKDFLTMFPYYPNERVYVIPLASRFPLEKIKHPPHFKITLRTGEFWLTVGTMEPRKNYATLLAAYAALLQEHPNTFPLAIAGGQGWRTEYLQSMIRAHGIQDNVYLLGYVSDEELQWLYQNCYAFVYPSLFEGFGLPPLEAMSMGAAVITSSTTSLPEVTSDAALLVSPTNVMELKDAMWRLHHDKDLYLKIKKKALLQAQKFSWERTAQNVLHVYDRVLSLPKFWKA
jgi:glycosyltransferase involved in cell wall biosynthesis